MIVEALGVIVVLSAVAVVLLVVSIVALYYHECGDKKKDGEK